MRDELLRGFFGFKGDLDSAAASSCSCCCEGASGSGSGSGCFRFPSVGDSGCFFSMSEFSCCCTELKDTRREGGEMDLDVGI